MKFHIKESKLKFKVSYIYYILIGIIFISITIVFFYQYKSIQQFRQEQIQRNNLISKESVEEPILDGLKPQIININGAKQTLYLPDKFKIDILTEGLQSPQFIEADDKGNLFVTDNKADTVWLIPIQNQKEAKVIDSKLKNLHSLDYYNNSLYIATDQQIIRYNDIHSDGSYKEKKVLIQNLPKPKLNSYHTIAIKDDRIYIGIPANCESCQPKDKRLGSIVSYSLEGDDEKLFARGIRQITDMQIQNNVIIATDIGRSGIGVQLPLVELNRVEEGKDYGWPYCYGNSNVDPKYTDKVDFCKDKVEPPISNLPKGNGVGGFDLIPSTFYKEFDNKYVFIYQGGEQNSIPKGYKVVIKNINQDFGAKNFITGWLLENGESWGSPKGVVFDNQGAMIITDQQNGLLYKVTKE
jgi:glucose/arabinose dehydrogenase